MFFVLRAKKSYNRKLTGKKGYRTVKKNIRAVRAKKGTMKRCLSNKGYNKVQSLFAANKNHCKQKGCNKVKILVWAKQKSL